MRIDTVWRTARLVTFAAHLPAHDGAAVIDCEGRRTTPGLIDCHTHLAHAGDRAAEFARRLAGASYAEIARAGGGILSTVRAVRAACAGTTRRSRRPRIAMPVLPR